MKPVTRNGEAWLKSEYSTTGVTFLETNSTYLT